eukprot:365788-Chlamydomonas_euryale.AAC.1
MAMPANIPAYVHHADGHSPEMLKYLQENLKSGGVGNQRDPRGGFRERVLLAPTPADADTSLVRRPPPSFQVITLAGDQVWRRRRYRVRRGGTPGTFHFSVLDNGVTSNEFWRIVDCSDDLEWCLFYYSGAASTAGLSYSGAVLGTRDGGMPAGEGAMARVEAALEASGIKTWELSMVDNSDLAGAPL